MSEAQPKKLGIQCVFECAAGDILVFIVGGIRRAKYVIYGFSKARPSKGIVFILLGRPSRAKYGTYNVFGVHFDFSEPSIQYISIYKITYMYYNIFMYIPLVD